jgi:hypothetical protein
MALPRASIQQVAVVPEEAGLRLPTRSRELIKTPAGGEGAEAMDDTFKECNRVNRNKQKQLKREKDREEYFAEEIQVNEERIDENKEGNFSDNGMGHDTIAEVIEEVIKSSMEMVERSEIAADKTFGHNEQTALEVAVDKIIEEVVKDGQKKTTWKRNTVAGLAEEAPRPSAEVLRHQEERARQAGLLGLKRIPKGYVVVPEGGSGEAAPPGLGPRARRSSLARQQEADRPEGERLACHLCAFSANGQRGLRIHIGHVHTGRGALVCPYCGFLAPLQARLDRWGGFSEEQNV